MEYARKRGGKWFLPSLGQWQLIVWGLLSKKNGATYSTPLTEVSNNDMTPDALGSILGKAGAEGIIASCDNYYSSTEGSDNSTWTFTLGNGSGGYVINSSKTGAWDPLIRAVVAF